MKTKGLKWAIGAGAALLMAASSAWAGDAVYGTGGTRTDAYNDAINKAQAEANKRGTCISNPDPSNCHQDGSGWVCIVYVANHYGSCGM